MLNFFHHCHAEILVGIFSATELKLNFKLISLVEEFLSVTQLGLVIMGSNFDTELDLLNLGCAVLVLFLLFSELVFELSKIRDAADRRICGRGYLDEIKAVRLGAPDSLLGLQNSELLACGADDDTHFAGANAVVDTNECWINGASVRLSARNGNGCCAGVRNCRWGDNCRRSQRNQATKSVARSYGERAVADFGFEA